jgi:hypothetical protein
MRLLGRGGIGAGIAGVGLVLSAAVAAQIATPTSPAAAFAQSLEALVPPADEGGDGLSWDDLERAAAIRWAPLRMRDQVFTDGTYFVRLGVADFGDGTVAAAATGARTIVMNVYFKSRRAPLGRVAILTALTGAGFRARLLRCPAAGAPPDGASWYRLTRPGEKAVMLGIDPGCEDTRQCEGVALGIMGVLPMMTPKEARITSEDCAGARAAVTPPGAPTDEETVARTIAALLPPAAHPGSAIPWDALVRIPPVAWKRLPPQRMDTSAWLDANPLILEGGIRLPTRRMTVFATGTAAGALAIYLRDDNFFAPTDAVAALRRDGFAIDLARCGKPYVTMREDWFRIAGPATAPAVLYRSRTCESAMCSENYGVLRGDPLPEKPGQRQPGVAGCQE